MKDKLFVICGPTATGKTAFTLRLAKKFAGEIISADSRQVYKGMDIVTGKDLPPKAKLINGHYLFDNIPVWGLDLVNPNEEFSVAHYQKIAQKIIKNIQSRRKLPILVGGTGLYIKAIVEGIETIGIPPNKKLRKDLQKLTTTQLQNCLKKINPSHFNKLNRSDKHNPRRLIRAIEIAKLNQPKYLKKLKKNIPYNTLIVGLKSDNQILYQRIDQRVEKRIKEGTQKEIRNLLKKGYSWKLPSMSALGYRQWRSSFEGKETKEQAIKKWKFAEHAYCRRQLTWFKKIKKIHWFDIKTKKFAQKIENQVKDWYHKNQDAKKN
jgi:tRNA dimethylallyltransferase